jgi:hypothetical protein
MTTKKAAKKKAKKKTTKKKVTKKTAPKAGDIIETLPTPVAEEPVVQVDLMAHNPEFQKFEIAKRIAHSLAHSNLVPEAYMGRPNDCFVAINMGAEIGLEPFQAIQSIAVIDGKPCLYGDGLIGVVRASPKCEWIEEEISSDGKAATCRTQRKGDRNPIERIYTMTDAMLAGIDSRKNWQKHPKRMLQMRARAYCLRDAYPDVLKGLGVVEEMVDHEDTPAPVTSYDLPEPKEDQFEKQAKEVFGDGVKKIEGRDPDEWLSEVEHEMYQSDTMEQLLKAADKAKGMPEPQAGTARITYKKMRAALLEDANNE